MNLIWVTHSRRRCSGKISIDSASLDGTNDELYKFFNTLQLEKCDSAYSMLYNYIIKAIKEKIDFDIFFDLVSDKCNYILLLKLKDEKNEVAKERDRLLNGNFSKEKIEEMDKLNFSNIKTGHEFELYLFNLFSNLGYESEVTKASGDQGADLIIKKNGIKTVVQAKFYSNPVGNKAIQEVVSSIAFYQANKGMVVTNNIFTKPAIELAKANNIELIDGQALDDIRNIIISRI